MFYEPSNVEPEADWGDLEKAVRFDRAADGSIFARVGRVWKAVPGALEEPAFKQDQLTVLARVAHLATGKLVKQMRHNYMNAGQIKMRFPKVVITVTAALCDEEERGVSIKVHEVNAACWTSQKKESDNG